ncbi:MBL fold metallo-hydrolase [Bacillaceae bacterium W0354]
MKFKSLTAYLFAFLLLLGACDGSEQAEPNKTDDSLNVVEENNDSQTKNDDIDNQAEEEAEEQSDKQEQVESNDEKIEKPTSIQGVLKAHYIDVGQADSTLIEYSYDGVDYRILIDAGDWKTNNVINYLNAQHIDHIDILVGTHAHADHIGQMDKVINQFDIDEVWMNGDTATSRTFERVIDALEASDASYYEPRTGDIFDVGPLQIEVVHPSSLTGNTNDDSISMKLTYGETTFLFTGDTERSGESAMLNEVENLNADILQLGHHGSSTSSTQRFLAAVSPDVAIYSAGAGNTYGHPHVEVVNRVLDAGIKLYGTDIHGTIIVTTDGKTYSIQTKKDGTITPSTTGGETSSKTTNQNTTSQTPTKNNTNSSSDNQSANKNCVNINTASFEELQRIKHVGPDRAQQIIDLRPFNSVNGLTRVKGIGDGRLKDIKAENLACVGG